MKHSRKNNRAFTLVELVIVIAVIAILAAVLIMAFSGVIRKANISKDTELIRNLNTALIMDKALGGKHPTMYSVLQTAEEAGYLVDRINASAIGNEILWDSVNDLFCYFDEDNDGKITYIPDFTPEEDSVDHVDYFVIKDKISDEFSTYYTGNQTDIVTTKGFDAGKTTCVKTVTYTNSGDEQDVIIRTNDFATTLTINAPLDTVYHYGNTSLVDVISINNASYHYFNTLGRLKVQNGHAVGEPGSAVITPMDMDGEETAASIEIKEGAKVYTEGDYDKLDNGVADGHVEDCGAGHHDFGEKIVVDNHVYELCKCCGYTLITVQDQLGNETKQSKNVITVDGEGNKTVTENVTPILTYEIETIISSTAVTEGTNYTIAKDNEGKEIKLSEEIEATKFTEEEQTCEHNFVGTVTLEATCTRTGIKTFVCDKCGASYNVTLAKIAHKYVTKTDDDTENKNHEYCTYCGVENEDMVAEVNGVQYPTVRSAFDSLKANDDHGNITDLTIIKLIANENIDIIANAITVESWMNVVLDLNGYMISGMVDTGSSSSLIKVIGNLTIKDSSADSKTGTGTGMILGNAANGWIYDGSGSYEGSYASNVITVNGANAQLTLNSGIVRTLKTTSSSAAYPVDLTCGSVVINNGLVQSYKGNALRQFSCNGATNVILNGGLIYGETYITYQIHGAYNSQSLTINGGEIKSDCEDYPYSIYFWATEGSHKIDTVITINGGKLSNDLYVHSAGKDMTLNITGGEFDGRISSTNNMAVSGGTFNTEDYYYCGYVAKSAYTEEQLTARGYKYIEYEGYPAYWKLYEKLSTPSASIGYVSRDNGDGTTTIVKANYIAYMIAAGNLTYCDLKESFDSLTEAISYIETSSDKYLALVLEDNSYNVYDYEVLYEYNVVYNPGELGATGTASLTYEELWNTRDTIAGQFSGSGTYIVFPVKCD